MSGVIEDLTDEVRKLSKALDKLCRKSGHEFTNANRAYPWCERHRNTAGNHATVSCDICGAFKCCEEGK